MAGTHGAPSALRAEDGKRIALVRVQGLKSLATIARPPGEIIGRLPAPRPTGRLFDDLLAGRDHLDRFLLVTLDGFGRPYVVAASAEQGDGGQTRQDGAKRQNPLHHGYRSRSSVIRRRHQPPGAMPTLAWACSRAGRARHERLQHHSSWPRKRGHATR